MNKIIMMIVGLLLVTGSVGSQAYNLDFSLHGARSSFLTSPPNDPNGWRSRFGTSLLYLSPTYGSDNERTIYRNRLLANGDTHIDVYARSQTCAISNNCINGYSNQRPRLEELNKNGLQPVVWLTGEQRHGDYKQNSAEQKKFFRHYVTANDDLVAGYVIGLEADEYWSAAQVNDYVAYVKTLTEKPVAVHLAPGVGGYKRDVNYYNQADYIYLQVGDHLTGDYTADLALAKAMLAEALALGKPVIVSEYSLNSESAAAKAVGDEMCRMGAVGTGNGRTINYCGHEEATDKNKEADYAVAVIGIAIAMLGAYYLQTNYDFEFNFSATDNYFVYGVKRVFQLTEQSSISLEANAYEQDQYDDNRVFVSYRLSW